MCCFVCCVSFASNSFDCLSRSSHTLIQQMFSRIKTMKKIGDCHRWTMIANLAYCSNALMANQPHFGLITCLALRISSFCIVTRCQRSQWSVDHGVRGCHNQVKEVAFHELAELELWVFRLGWRLCLRSQLKRDRHSGNLHDLLRELVNFIMNFMFMTLLQPSTPVQLAKNNRTHHF